MNIDVSNSCVIFVGQLTKKGVQIMSKFKMFALVALALLMVLFIGATNVSATRHDVQGLVFIDDNLNGVWDVGEEGYGGHYEWVPDEDVFRYVGATVTLLTPAYDEFEVESLGFRELGKGEGIACTQQDYLMEDGETVNSNAVRPCLGTFGFPLTANETYMQITVTPPEGYKLTSTNPQTCVTGEAEREWMDFGIAPIAEAAEAADAAAAEAAAEAAPAFHMEVSANGFVPGLVYIDGNGNGVWDVGEAGYGGQMGYDAENEVDRYIGATVTFISPAYDEFTVESMGHRELDEGETVICSQQDLVFDGEIMANPVRPCEGTFGLTHAGEDVRWEVVLSVPAGYTLTTANPQYYTTGSGQMPVDFGIVPAE